jgi:hypothetical protein
MTGLIQLVWDRTLLGIGEDKAITTHHWGNDAQPLAASVINEIDTNLGLAWPSLAPRLTSKIKVSQIRLYHAEAVPPSTPTAVKNVNYVGTSFDNPMPPQVACTVTERTDIPRRWGRYYIPGVVSSTADAFGRMSSTLIASIVAFADKFYQPLATSNLLHPQVYSRLYSDARNVTSMQVDDLFDVQRRRRFDAPAVRTVINEPYGP